MMHVSSAVIVKTKLRARCRLPFSAVRERARALRVCRDGSLLGAMLSASWHLQREVSALAVLDGN